MRRFDSIARLRRKFAIAAQETFKRTKHQRQWRSELMADVAEERCLRPVDLRKGLRTTPLLFIGRERRTATRRSVLQQDPGNSYMSRQILTGSSIRRREIPQAAEESWRGCARWPQNEAGRAKVPAGSLPKSAESLSET